MTEAIGPASAAPAEPPTPPLSGHRSLRRAGLLLGFSTTTANVLGYAFAIVLSRSLGPADYGALAALLAAGLIGSIPGVALQLVVARSGSREGLLPGQAAAEAARWVRLSVVVGAVLMLLTWVLAPAAESYLALTGPEPVLWLGAVMWSSTVTGAFQGMLLGGERHERLSASYLTVAGFRFVSGCVAAVGGWSLGGAIAAAAVAALLATGACAWLAGVPGGTPGGIGYRALLTQLATASSSTAAILVLSNVDVVLARHYLVGAGSGHYAVGSLFTKAAFWGPHFLAVLAYPRLARPGERRRSLRTALAVTLGIGALAVVGALVVGHLLISVTAGSAYTDIAGLAPVFAGLGTMMAMMQLTIYAGLARGRRITEVLVWCGIAAEIGTVTGVMHGSPGQIVTACLAVAAVVTVVAVAVELEGSLAR